MSVSAQASPNQNEDSHETCHASTFPRIGLNRTASHWSILGASYIPQDISHIYIKIFDIILSFWHTNGKKYPKKSSQSHETSSASELLNEGRGFDLFVSWMASQYNIWGELVSNVLNTGSDNISLTPIIITILTITIRPGLASNKAQFMTN